MVRLFQDGHVQAFDELYERYKTVALRSAFLLTGNFCDSENVLQETFLKCYQHLPGLKKAERFKPWFFRILTRTAWDYCRKSSRECPMGYVFEAYQAELPGAESSLDILAAAEERRELAAAIDKLPLKQKTVVVLYYYNEMSVQEIAGICGTLPGTVKSRLHAARRKLQEILVAQETKGSGESLRVSNDKIRSDNNGNDEELKGGWQGEVQRQP